MELSNAAVTMHFVFPDYDVFVDYQNTLQHHFILYSYMPDNSVTRSYYTIIKDNSFSQIHVNDFIYYSSLSMRLLSKGIDLYIDYKHDYLNIDKTIFRYLLYKNVFLSYGVEVGISTSNVIIHDHYYSQINKHLTLSVLDTYSTIYRNDQNDLPYFGPPIMLFKVENSINGIIYFFNSLNVVINIIFLLFVIIKRKSKIIRRAFTLFCILVIISSMLISVSALYLTIQPTSEMECAGQIIFFLISVILMLSTLFIKIFKVHKVLNNTGIKKVKITQFDFLYNVSLIVVLFTIYTVIWNLSLQPTYLYIISYLK